MRLAARIWQHGSGVPRLPMELSLRFDTNRQLRGLQPEDIDAYLDHHLGDLDREPAIMVREPDATLQPPPQDHQLMSKRRVVGFKPQNPRS